MAAKRTRKLLVLALCLHNALLFSQTTFQKTFGGSGQEVGTWVLEASNGYLIAGHVTNTAGNQDALLLRLDASGNALWQKRFGAAQPDAFHSAVATTDGGFVAVGETRGFGAESTDLFLVKVDASGTLVWSKVLNEGISADVAKSIVLLPDGGFLASGTSTLLNNTVVKSVVLRLDANGNTLWSRSYAGIAENALLCNYVEGNVIHASGSLNAEGAYVRLSLTNGDVLSAKGYASASTEALTYQQPTLDGKLVMADFTRSAVASTETELWAQKIDPNNGQVIWSKAYFRANDNIRGRIEKVSDGGFLLTPYDQANTAQADALLAKIDANGNLLWSYNYGGPSADRLMKAVQTSDGGFIAVGDTRSGNGNSNSHLLVVKTDAQGRIQGNCPKDGGIQAVNFPTNTSAVGTTSLPWLQTATVATSPLPISLLPQTFNTNPAPVVPRNIALCANQSFTVGGVAYFAPKLVSDTVSSLAGCDTIFLYNLSLKPYNTGIHVIGLCSGETYSIDGIAYEAPITVVDTVASLNGGCDTLCTFVLKVWAQPTASQTIAFCAGESVLIGGHAYSQPGVVEGFVPSLSGGCDTLVTYTLVERPNPTRSTHIAFCPGESVLIGGQSYSQSQTVITKIPAVNVGCDTIVTYTLELRPQPERTVLHPFCPGEWVTVGGQAYNQSTTVVENVPSLNGGCDTIVTHVMELRPQATRAETRGFCPGESVTIAGQTYQQPGTVIANIASTTGGCDTIVTYTLELRPQPTRAETRGFCPGESVTIAGQTYQQPGTVIANVASTTGGCDTIVTYNLELRPQATRAETRDFCPGESVLIAGQTYYQPGTVVANIASTTGGCDTVVTYTLELRPQATRSETRGFCPGETVTIAGHEYTQPITVIANVPSNTGGCDTVVTYQLQHLTPAPSNIAIQCPNDVVVAAVAGNADVLVNYASPIAASDCVCPGLDLARTQGLASGSAFPMGTTQVCYTAKDHCGQEKPCCFAVKIQEENPCDAKVNGCLTYELLSITADAAKNHTYRVRVTNNCANKLVYTAIEIPQGILAMAPANNSIYATGSEHKYIVRSPNYSPMYSIRFKSTSDSLSNGQSDVFQYTLPAQASVTYINITSRLDNQLFYEAHLNTFNCPVGVTPTVQTQSKARDAEEMAQQNSLLLFPNPTTGVLYADLSDWLGQKLQVQITNAQGQKVHMLQSAGQEDVLRVDMPQGLSSGVYFLEVATEKGEKEVMRFMLQR